MNTTSSVKKMGSQEEGKYCFYMQSVQMQIKSGHYLVSLLFFERDTDECGFQGYFPLEGSLVSLISLGNFFVNV